jgi:multidrug efflux pump subunit AcrA (membrane-fusion protein)
MRLALVTVLCILIVATAPAAPVSVDEQLPTVSRERLSISTVRRGDLVRRLEAYGLTRRSEAAVEAVLHVAPELVQDMMVGQPALLGVARGLHRGRVSKIQPLGADFQVAVSLERQPAGLPAGEPVAASIIAEELNDVLLVAGVARLLPGSTVSWFKLDRDADYATRVRVRIGKTASRQAEIFSGLSEGDRVITMGLDLPETVNRVRLR